MDPLHSPARSRSSSRSGSCRTSASAGTGTGRRPVHTYTTSTVTKLWCFVHVNSSVQTVLLTFCSVRIPFCSRSRYISRSISIDCACHVRECATQRRCAYVCAVHCAPSCAHPPRPCGGAYTGGSATRAADSQKRLLSSASDPTGLTKWVVTDS